MENKDMCLEIDKIKDMVKKKLVEYGRFCSFGVAYTPAGNKMAQIEDGLTGDAVWDAFDKMVVWMKERSPYMVVAGMQTKDIGSVGGREPKVENGVLIVAMTRTETKNLYVTFTVQDGEYLFSEEITAKLDNRVSVALSKIFSNGRHVC